MKKLSMIVVVLLLSLGCNSQFHNQKEVRAVWGGFPSGGVSLEKNKVVTEINKSLDLYSSMGINTVYCFSAMQDQNKWDFLNVYINAAHSRKIEVHPIFSPGAEVKLEGDIKQHLEWLIRGKNREIYPYLNLAHIGAQDYILSKISEVLKYNIDGIQLDGIRFQVNQGFSYDEANCSAFKKEFGISPLEIKKKDSGDLLWCEWINWNARQVTNLVTRIKKLIDDSESGKNIPLSAAVFPNHVIAKIDIGQDWGLWANEELIDVYCPMQYTDNNNVFRRTVRAAVKLNNGKKGMVYTGIGISSSHNNGTPENVAQQVRIAREEGADGVVFFSASRLTEDFVNELKSDVFKME